MKKLVIYIFLFVTLASSSQELMNFYIEPSPTNDVVELHTVVYRSTFTFFGSSSISVVDNTITMTLCYINTNMLSETFDPQSFDITLPTGYTNYTLNIEVYGDNDASPPCALTNLVDSGTVEFNFPYNPTEKTTIPDDTFEAYLEDLGFGDDLGNNNLVYTHRITNISRLFLSNLFTIESLEGINVFTSLKDLRFSNNLVTQIDLSSNSRLERLFCDMNPLIQLDVTNNTLLKDLICSSTGITSLDLTNNISLGLLYMGYNNIDTIDLSQNINLRILDIDNCQISELNLSNNIFLEVLICPRNNLQSLDLSNNDSLDTIFCVDNQISSFNIDGLSNLKIVILFNNHISEIDLSNNSQLQNVSVSSDSLISLNVKNGNNGELTTLSAISSNLYCVEVDDENAANNGDFPYSNWNLNPQTSYSEDCSLVVDENQVSNNILLFPNPVQNVLHIKAQNNILINTVFLYDMAGRLIYQNTDNVSQIDMETLNNGLYFVKIETSKGSFTNKIVKK